MGSEFRIAGSAIDVVLFDAVGTLFFPNPPVSEAYAMFGRQYGSRLSPDEITPRFRTAFQRQEAIDRLDAEGRTGDERERRRWREIVAEVFVDVSDTAHLFDALWNHFARPGAWALFDDVTPTVDALLALNVTVGAASNFDARLTPIVAAHLPQLRPEHVFTSVALGYRKPSSAFFRACAQRLAITDCSLRILLVGDDPQLDVAAARAAGWHSLLVDRNGTDADKTSRLGGLAQLVG